jgi:quercetin dioxygenase-like cupin family protein
MTRKPLGSVGFSQGRLSPCQTNYGRLTICLGSLDADDSGHRKGRASCCHGERSRDLHRVQSAELPSLLPQKCSPKVRSPQPQGALRETILSQTDGPMPGYMTLLVEATIEAGVKVGRHTHPGIESSYVLEGGFELPIDGQPTRTIKAGDGFQIPAETPHAGGKPGEVKSRILITYVVEKGRPLASPA